MSSLHSHFYLEHFFPVFLCQVFFCKSTVNKARYLNNSEDHTTVNTLWGSLDPVIEFNANEQHSRSIQCFICTLRFLFCTTRQITLYHVDHLSNNGYPMELAGVQDILVLLTKLQTNSNHISYWSSWVINTKNHKQVFLATNYDNLINLYLRVR